MKSQIKQTTTSTNNNLQSKEVPFFNRADDSKTADVVQKEKEPFFSPNPQKPFFEKASSPMDATQQGKATSNNQTSPLANSPISSSSSSRSIIQRQIGSEGKIGMNVIKNAEERYVITDIKLDPQMGQVMYTVQPEGGGAPFLVPSSNPTFHLIEQEQRNRKDPNAKIKAWEKKPMPVEMTTGMKPDQNIKIDSVLLADPDIGYVMKKILLHPPKSIEALEVHLSMARDLLNQAGRIFEIGARFAQDDIKIVKGSDTEKEVPISELSDNPTAKDPALKGAVLTHTHPQGRPLSDGDIGKAAQLELREIRAVGLTTCTLKSRQGNKLTFNTKPSKMVDASSDRMQDAIKTANTGSKKWSSQERIVRLHSGQKIDLTNDVHLIQWFGAAYAANVYNWQYEDGTGQDSEGRDARAYAALVLEHVYKIDKIEAQQIVSESAFLFLQSIV